MCLLICKYCKKEFEWWNVQKRYCSNNCKDMGGNTHPNFYNKICKVCNKSFLANNIRAIYCSKKCKNEYYKLNPIKHKYILGCNYCGKNFEKILANKPKENENHYCSQKCVAYNKNKIGIGTKYNCKKCGKEFYQTNKRHYFCCVECKGLYNYKKAPQKQIMCSNCGKIFKRSQHWKDNKNRFCSKSCESEFREKESDDIRFCEFCQEEIHCKKGDKLRFCGYECQGKWQSEYRIGKNASSYNFNITDEMRIKNCEICGKEIFGTPKEFETKKYCSDACKRSATNKTMTHPHKLTCSILDELEIIFDTEHKFGRFATDNFLLDFKYAIETMGSFWHCDIRLYKKPKSKLQEISFDRDKRKNTLLKENGIPILYLWEYDLENNIEICKKLVQKFIKNNGVLNNYHSMNYDIQNEELKLNKLVLIPHFEKQ